MRRSQRSSPLTPPIPASQNLRAGRPVPPPPWSACSGGGQSGLGTRHRRTPKYPRANSTGVGEPLLHGTGTRSVLLLAVAYASARWTELRAIPRCPAMAAGPYDTSENGARTACRE